VAYEVTKHVGGRAYRYRVESYRDSEAGRVRSRWTYLGVVSPGGVAAAPAKRRETAPTRERLIDAFETLTLAAAYRDVTAGAVATRAGVAHGTFYRYFSDKRALLLASLERVKRELDRLRPDFDSALGTREDERRRVRDWVGAIFALPPQHYGLVRAYREAIESDADLRAAQVERKVTRKASTAAYLERLHAAGLARVPRPMALATALTLLIDGALHDILAASDRAPDPLVAEGTIEAFDRAIFAER
jgi:AcrR family transcriptional regulator